jgi:hypothetical protein
MEGPVDGNRGQRQRKVEHLGDEGMTEDLKEFGNNPGIGIGDCILVLQLPAAASLEQNPINLFLSLLKQKTPCYTETMKEAGHGPLLRKLPLHCTLSLLAIQEAL